jgi:autotransporter-associated beta strand protein
MKSFSKFQAPRLARSPLALAVSAMIFTFSGSALWAASNTWIPGGNGSYTDASKWTGGVNVPNGATDVAAIDGTGSVVALSSNVTLQSLDLALTTSGGAPIFNHNSGDLSVGTLRFGGGGGSRNPNYNLSDGLLSIATSFTWGNGNNAKFNVSGGTVDFAGTSLNVGVASGAKGSIIMTGGVFNANSVPQVNLANNNASSVQALVDLSGNAKFNATTSTFVIGQFGAATGTGVFATLNMAGTAELNTTRVVLGGNNVGTAVYGVINLNGGTISAGSIRKGTGSIAASSTANVIHANGGTVKAIGDAGNTNFFQGAFVDLQAGGLNFDTNSNYVTITNVMSGPGGLTKQGDGALTLAGTNTYEGATTVAGGELTLGSATAIPDTSHLTVTDGALVNLDGVQDRVGSLTLGATHYTANGTYGSSQSGADVQNDNFFTGSGTILIGPPQAARNLAWTGASLQPFWMTAGTDENFIDTADSSPTIFHTGDTVAFNDLTDPALMTVSLSGNVQPGGMIFNNTAGNPYVIDGFFGSLLGAGGVVKNGAGDVTIGGTSNSYTGTIAVTSGKLIMGSNSAFGNSSGITIAPGAQVDINGYGPGSLYTYTIAGTGPGNTGLVVNSGGARFGDSGIKNLFLTGDASIGSDGSRFDFGQGGTVSGNGHTLTKVGNNDMGFRGDASASPINIVAAGGTVWAESSANAYGGATGTLTIKSGARAGTYGTLTIATPVAIESGGTLHNQGVATGTWTGNFNLSGDVAIDSAGSPIVISGNVSGTANITKSGASNVTIADPDHIGNTTVTSGPLTVTSATLYDGATITLNGATATLNLTHGGSDTVDKLVLDSVQQQAGTYVSPTNTQAIPGAIATAYIVGDTGSLVVTSSPGGATGFTNWADASITNPAYSSLKGRQDDPDNDGFTNLEEFLFGTNPQTNTGTLTQLTQVGSNLHIRWNERATGAAYTLQESVTLAENPWPASGATPVVSGDQTGVPADYTRKEATVPVDSVHKFVRVMGVEN